MTGQPWKRISRAVAVIPAYSWTLMCWSYHGPSRSPAGRPAACSVAATNGPYIVSLSSSAGAGASDASSMRATVLFPAPGGPATTNAGAGTLMHGQARSAPVPHAFRPAVRTAAIRAAIWLAVAHHRERDRRLERQDRKSTRLN